ncbi:MAG: hypothetical protein II768_03185 [Clostridia bacterium]|nr:hypothetical protein [Clostridia bacterium]
MKHNARAILFTEVILLSILSLLFGGCIRKIPAAPDPPVPAADESLPGELVGIRHESSGGSMVYRSEFAIEVTPDEIVHAEYWPENYRRDMVVRDHVPIKASQWADLEKITRILWPLMKEVTPYEPDEDLFADGEEIFVLDGGDYNRWYFTWKTDEGERTIQVYAPQDRRITTLRDLLRELAEPIGRKIVWYDPPKLDGIYFCSDEDRYSYQCTCDRDEKDLYRCYFYFIENGERKSVSATTDGKVWQKVYDFCEPLNLAAFPEGNGMIGGDPLTCTLYYDDGRQKTVIPDEATVEKLLSFFEEMCEELR